jgi:hypothetical protein
MVALVDENGLLRICILNATLRIDLINEELPNQLKLRLLPLSDSLTIQVSH